MPILHVLDTPINFIVQQCSECGVVHTIPMTQLQLGTDHDHNLIAMPACTCGAQEYFNRTFDEVAEHLADHRKKVNALAIALKDNGQVHAKHSDRIKAEKHEPKQVGELVGPVKEIPGMPEKKIPKGVRLPK